VRLGVLGRGLDGVPEIDNGALEIPRLEVLAASLQETSLLMLGVSGAARQESAG
jgi:hypothetical protein